ncbi:hypothetical protein A2955_02960 [Candidatus Woesebacteria bacterium RIFCSPLOWO2_01_FULL_37_19]|uniref:Uncharacterized protein n=2 Tax=Candidatus Woeseibacteriota TaxID=1752722 RepID=A0A1F8BBM9_9BACT|nr:MAG: hypothetical protein A2771_00115 [Candidatus Woesebacteria bacterium RIFCSPHIGHO2_01_FULL_38_26b]OGM61423.1 MAG: hypothetical protein A2955_02960 [Candidatus Woesebacteria bacterium RIFCSPLOWO2_01_FULL_37_19]
MSENIIRHAKKSIRKSLTLIYKGIIRGMAERYRGEKAINISRAIDAGTIVGALILGGLNPALAVLAIEASVVTLAGAEIIDPALKRRKRS